MGVAERRSRERSEREARIKDAARTIAARDGWSAVTIRRLAEEIEYSQPVVYSHFENRDAIVAAVATQGFAELAAALRGGRQEPADAAQSYLTFARDHPALYEAMFSLPNSLDFAGPDTRPELHDAFDALAQVVALPGPVGEVATETFWAALHGLAELERSGRIRPSACDARVTLLVNALFEHLERQPR
jgi:AcrR family transcriptional regulator